MTDVEKQILENQEVLLLATSKLILGADNIRDLSSVVKINNSLIDNYHRTRKMLGKDYIKRWSDDD